MVGLRAIFKRPMNIVTGLENKKRAKGENQWLVDGCLGNQRETAVQREIAVTGYLWKLVSWKRKCISDKQYY